MKGNDQRLCIAFLPSEVVATRSLSWLLSKVLASCEKGEKSVGTIFFQCVLKIVQAVRSSCILDGACHALGLVLRLYFSSLKLITAPSICFGQATSKKFE